MESTLAQSTSEIQGYWARAIMCWMTMMKMMKSDKDGLIIASDGSFMNFHDYRII